LEARDASQENQGAITGIGQDLTRKRGKSGGERSKIARGAGTTS